MPPIEMGPVLQCKRENCNVHGGYFRLVLDATDDQTGLPGDENQRYSVGSGTA
jgi:hypothetical protein